MPGERQYWYSHSLDYDDQYRVLNDRVLIGGRWGANLIGSETEESGIHLPLFDIDYDAQLLSSSTPGHFHLYLNKPVEWDAYVRVLEALRDAELIEEGFCRNSIARGQAFLRTPDTRKPGGTNSFGPM
jgi:hypothetical protein